MSTQSSQSVKKSLDCLDSSSLSNSQIVQATDLAFSHQRLDIGIDSYNNEHNEVVSLNPLDTPSTHSSRLQLKKRKKDFESARSDYAASDFKTDFLSGIFQDISQAEQGQDDSCEGNDVGCTTPSNGDEHITTCISDDERTHLRKRVKTSGSFNTLSRIGKSFPCLKSISNCPTEDSRLGSSINNGFYSRATCDKLDTQSRRVSVGNQKTSFVTVDTPGESTILDKSCIHNLVDKVLEDSLAFPRLPPTVSDSSCNSNDLTHTPVHAVQGRETLSSIVVGGYLQRQQQQNVDTYGWFVDMDLEEDNDRADVISAAQESCRASVNDEDLSFKAFTAPKKTSKLDDEVEWAKAADTVDDVLGDFF